MSVLKNCKPERVFYYFEQLCAIPHGSGNTRGVSDFCVRFAKEHGLAVSQDEQNNVIIRKNAAPGYENAPTLILQGHLDMVCVKEPDCAHDFLTDGLALTVEGDWLRAEGTSLGGDNGIAVAMTLAILEDDTLAHGPLEALFTTDEETGMYGAEAVDFSLLKGRWLINIDSEEEGVITAGCAGGARADCLLSVNRRELRGHRCTLTIDGLKGGHSGGEIDKGRGMANELLGRVLYAMEKTAPFGIVDLCGGTVENAIPNKAVAELAIPAEHFSALAKVAADYAAIYARELSASDADVRVTLTKGAEETLLATDADSNSRLVFAMLNLPYGVQVMSMDIPGLVQTSLNMGVLRMSEREVQMSFSVRSSILTQKEWLCDRLANVMERAGGTVSVHAAYPAWEFRRDSKLRELVVQYYTEFYGKAPEITATHGGLECGLFSGKAPELDCVSIGPNLFDVHSTAEKLSISSTERVYRLLLKILESCR